MDTPVVPVDDRTPSIAPDVETSAGPRPPHLRGRPPPIRLRSSEEHHGNDHDKENLCHFVRRPQQITRHTAEHTMKPDRRKTNEGRADEKTAQGRPWPQQQRQHNSCRDGRDT